MLFQLQGCEARKSFHSWFRYRYPANLQLELRQSNWVRRLIQSYNKEMQEKLECALFVENFIRKRLVLEDTYLNKNKILIKSQLIKTIKIVNIILMTFSVICKIILDEIIRQVTINCAERGILLLRIRDEMNMSLNAFQALYESSIAYGIRKSLAVNFL